MNSEEKLEQSNIVKERGTVYFKVSQGQGTPGSIVQMVLCHCCIFAHRSGVGKSGNLVSRSHLWLLGKATWAAEPVLGV